MPIDKLKRLVVENLSRISNARLLNINFPECQVYSNIAFNNLTHNTEDMVRLPESSNVNTLLNVVGYKEHLDPFYESDYYNIIDDFFTKDVYKLTGLSYIDYMNLIPEEQITLLEFIQAKKEHLEKELEEARGAYSDGEDIDKIGGLDDEFSY